jgi:hypothetical protein
MQQLLAPLHFQELKISGEELIALNPQLNVRFRKFPSYNESAQWSGETRYPVT